ncbi:MAG: HAMP domain-containing protein, partial [Anaerolineae bacterium]|nr:HAMP domain-containing protein [Phycisphaerae bacterium]
MLSVGQKLSLGFGGLLAILIAVSVVSVARLNAYSRTLERIFRENYDSVTFSLGMQVALNDMDDVARSAVVETDHAIGAPTTQPAGAAIARFIARFDENLARELGNLTLPGEREAANAVALSWKEYQTAHAELLSAGDATTRLQVYRDRLSPLRHQVDGHAQRVIEMNLQNIVSVDGQVRRTVVRAKRTLYAFVAAGLVLAVVFVAVISRSILQPLRSLTKSAREIERGNLDLVVKVRGRDEVGQLAEAFNAMAAKLREFRRSDHAKLVRTQQTTQLAVNSLPDAVAIVSADGRVELANDSARKFFGLSPDADLAALRDSKLLDLYRTARDTGQAVTPAGYESVVQVFDDGGVERFFLPQAIPIVDNGAPVGVTLVLADVTNLRKLDEMKSGLLSVVSHELKTPLTSIRMATHLLLEERVGPLTAKQAELLVAARDDSDRLHQIIENLLDMGRIESGRAQFSLQPVQVDQLVRAAVEPHISAFRDKGVELHIEVAPETPNVLAEADRLEHVFANLLTNALKFTPPGGKVWVRGFIDPEDPQWIKFTVSDTGVG